MTLALTFPLLIFGWGWVSKIMSTYQVERPGMFYLGCEILWDWSLIMTLFHMGILSMIWRSSNKGLGFIKRFTSLMKQGKELAMKELRPAKKKAWMWFSLNRFTAMIQPVVTGVLVSISSVPLLLKLALGLFLLLDLAHTVVTILQIHKRLGGDT